MTIISYAQNFEDIMLLRALGDVAEGFYIDIGACSPDADSVTRLFYDNGWRGINVEPHPLFLQKLKSGRPEDTNLGLVVTKTEGTATFYRVGDTGLSSANPEIAKTHETAGLLVTELEMPATTLRGLWTGYVPEGQAVHFLKIDVEGAEADVISGGDWRNHRPWIVVVEATVPNRKTPNHFEWESHLLDNDYSFVHWDGLNRFYLAKEHQDLQVAFSAPPNIFDDFKLYSQVLVEQQAKELQQQIKGLQQQAKQLQQQIKGLQQQVANLQKAISEEMTMRAEAERELRYLKRPFLERVLFHKGGKPKHILQRLLFHYNGKPRGIFRNLVLHQDGKPHGVFREWMTSREYQALPRAVILVHQAEGGPMHESMSVRARYFSHRLSAANSAVRNR